MPRIELTARVKNYGEVLGPYQYVVRGASDCAVDFTFFDKSDKQLGVNEFTISSNNPIYEFYAEFDDASCNDEDDLNFEVVIKGVDEQGSPCSGLASVTKSQPCKDMSCTIIAGKVIGGVQKLMSKPAGGAAPYTYLWKVTSGSAIITDGRTASTVTVDRGKGDAFCVEKEITDANGCSVIEQVCFPAVNQAPVVNDYQFIRPCDDNITKPIAVDVLSLANDVDGYLDPSTVVNLGPPPGTGILAFLNGFAIYTPDPSTVGVVTLNLAISDNNGVQSLPNTTLLQITPCNEAPNLVTDQVTTPCEKGIVIDVLANDTDDGNIIPGSLQIVSQPLNGTAVITNGQILYTPKAGFEGLDLGRYCVRDNQGAVSIGRFEVTVQKCCDNHSVGIEFGCTVVNGEACLIATMFDSVPDALSDKIEIDAGAGYVEVDRDCDSLTCDDRVDCYTELPYTDATGQLQPSVLMDIDIIEDANDPDLYTITSTFRNWINQTLADKLLAYYLQCPGQVIRFEFQGQNLYFHKDSIIGLAFNQGSFSFKYKYKAPSNDPCLSEYEALINNTITILDLADPGVPHQILNANFQRFCCHEYTTYKVIKVRRVIDREECDDLLLEYEIEYDTNDCRLPIKKKLLQAVNVGSGAVPGPANKRNYTVEIKGVSRVTAVIVDGVNIFPTNTYFDIPTSMQNMEDFLDGYLSGPYDDAAVYYAHDTLILNIECADTITFNSIITDLGTFPFEEL